MVAERTLVTELGSALGTLGYERLTAAVLDRSPRLEVDAEVWETLAGVVDAHQDVAASAFANGQALLASPSGLDRRQPRSVVWAGGRRPPGDEVVPGDLMIDGLVFVSCKYGSKVLHNASPFRLFDDLLHSVDRRARADWYTEVAVAEHAGLLAATAAQLGVADLPARIGDLSPVHRKALKGAARLVPRRELVEATRSEYAELVAAVSRGSADRWDRALTSRERRERMLWRLLRIYGTPYFLLGEAEGDPVRVRVLTPWEWRRRFEFDGLEVSPADAGQPRVDWRATVRDRVLDADRVVDGHVEIRWSHGRFAQPPEAKVYLDTPHHEVPGYEPLG